MNPNDNRPLLSKESPWCNNSNSIWLGTTLTLLRNLEKFNFPGKLSGDKRKQIISLLTHSMLTNNYLQGAKLFRAEDMPPIEKEFLVEHFLSNQSFQHAHAGEAFVLDETGEFLIALNLKDHILLHCIDAKENLEDSWDRLINVELALSKVANFAFSSKFGFLTSDPTQSGTGLVATLFLHLPGLLHENRLEEILKKNRDDSVVQTGLQGDPTDLIGDIVAFHNSYTLGVTEENILHSLRTLATKLVLEENSLRQRLRHGHEREQVDFKDKVSRAYGLLLHSYQIEAVEALEALSLLKIGLDVAWVKGITHVELNRIIFACRRAHLLCHYAQKISAEELPHKRAEFIHQTLGKIELLI